MVCTDQRTACTQGGPACQHSEPAWCWQNCQAVGKNWGGGRGSWYNKYRVRVDGSGRVTDRNRQFLRLFKPATFTYSPGITQTTREVDPHPIVGDGQEVHPVTVPEVVNAPVAPSPPDTAATPDVQTPHVEHSPAPVADHTPEPELHQPTPVVGSEQVPGPYGPVRRSVRVRKPNQLYGPDVNDLSRR